MWLELLRDHFCVGGLRFGQFMTTKVLRATQLLGNIRLKKVLRATEMLGNTCVLERGFQDANAGQNLCS